MKKEIDLPHNRTFGIFLATVLVVVGIYFYHSLSVVSIYLIYGTAGFVLFMAYFKPDMLFPLNVLWMRFGFFLGAIVSPLILAVIFFLLFTPTAVLMRLAGRDELRLNFVNKRSHWIHSDELAKSDSFEQQF